MNVSHSVTLKWLTFNNNNQNIIKISWPRLTFAMLKKDYEQINAMGVLLWYRISLK